MENISQIKKFVVKLKVCFTNKESISSTLIFHASIKINIFLQYIGTSHTEGMNRN